MNRSILRVCISGDSMYPSLLPNDTVIISQCEDYPIGAILVFAYKSENYIIHRLLHISNNYFYCKGDNSFRLEDIKKEQILGKVIFVKRGNRIIVPSEVDEKFIQMSLKVNREFVLSGYDPQKVMKSNIYNEYKNLITYN